MSDERPKEPTDATQSTGWRAYRREITFLVVFLVLLAGSFTLISWNPVNDLVIEPFTGGVAVVSGWT
ncbi:MAG TPA: hypothetical protein VKU40_10435, partial [Thermoanaerobaculia bacterium]|nr:hypothetical protein [Thermoanaerobaculia bacterium]